jgi:hypothetical protein
VHDPARGTTVEQQSFHKKVTARRQLDGKELAEKYNGVKL